jgi:D-glycerate 3-kinase
MRIARLAGLAFDESVIACAADLDPSAPVDYRELAALWAHEWRRDRSRRIGLSGGQGAGKSTLAALMEAACLRNGLRCCVLSLDDFYLSKSERRGLAASIHPLFETRGPPGTHDMGRLERTLDALEGAGAVRVPRFDKGRDDRIEDRVVDGPFDLVVLEGWCVGVRSAEASGSAEPLNAVEADRDPDGTWRRAVEHAIAEDYEPIWDRLDRRIHLSVPSLDAVRRWRGEQERARPEMQRMGAAEVDTFVQFFERWTRRLDDPAVLRADWTVTLDESHAIAGLSIRDR